MFTCKQCGCDLGWDRPSGVCSEACLAAAQGFLPSTPVLVHERSDGVKVEYRRRPGESGCVLSLECRRLRPDGTPHDGRWWPVSDAHLLALQTAGSDIVAVLSE